MPETLPDTSKPSEKLSVLYVDDEEQNLVSFRAAFRRHFNVYTANSGKEGLEILQQYPISLIITDQRMPEMTGVQFLEKVIPVYPDTIRMILTGFSDIEAIISAINTGRVFRYITKPWDEQELKMTIENAWEFYKLQQQNKKLVADLQSKIEEQEKTLRLFQRYVPQEVVNRALAATSEASIFAGELRNVTVLFCDIRGFTSISEKLEPREVVNFLNEYYGTMSEVITSYDGTVNQFVGDEIFACFGAPVGSMHNEENAVFAALDMLARVPVLNARYAERFGAPVEVGIGVHCGEVVAGNVGSEERIEYSLTGDTVNTGKRIESLTKDTPNTLLISEAVVRRVSHLVETKAWEPVLVKGKAEPLHVYEVLDRKEAK